MSAAPELPPIVHIPERARRRTGSARGGAQLAPARRGVVVAFPCGAVARPEAEHSPIAAPDPVIRGERWAGAVRLTRRGYVVLGLVAAITVAALLWVAHLSVPTSQGGASAPAAVTVHDGDTLWSIASQVAPGRDPRVVVAELQRMNGLDGVALVPGQVLRTR